ncbi:uncharacterized protein LOC131680082 [Topomyia yanbarensis]|uniref:uncharacterized protein LOC131680082 n=1 Tax=Topomyia yanbarensis TaxID=2498891 RepID=UPI00273B3EE5|nr:uncharacterized protein LOC131680082 [Topomyia yanbarensis]
MEALDLPATVEPLQPAFSSRPGPVCVGGEGVFQAAFLGNSSSNTRRKLLPSRSCSPHRSIGVQRILGRTAVGTMEALEPPATVEQLQPAIISRPGPVCGMGERVFQPATNGKYTSDPNTSSADVFFASSNLPFALTSCDEMSTISVADDDRCILERDAVDSPSAEPDPSSNNIEIYYQNTITSTLNSLCPPTRAVAAWD